MLGGRGRSCPGVGAWTHKSERDWASGVVHAEGGRFGCLAGAPKVGEHACLVGSDGEGCRHQLPSAPLPWVLTVEAGPRAHPDIGAAAV